MTVYLVGAGPGAPGLLTVRGAEVLAAAHVVVHDGSPSPEILALAEAHAQCIDVSGGAGTAQHIVDQLLIDHGRTGKNVVRLYGGDAFVSSPGGHEAGALMAQGLDVEVVPGVPVATAAPAMAGIPVADTYGVGSFTVVSGRDELIATTSAHWSSAARQGGTIVITGGLADWSSWATTMMDNGVPADTPAAAIGWASRPEQRSSRATLATLGGLLPDDPSIPTTFVIGGVAALDVGTFESLPLFGKRVIVTRTKGQAAELSDLLRRRGAAPIEVPTIEIVEPSDGGADMRRAIERLDTYDWLTFTSPNGAARFCDALRDARQVGRAKVAAIGPGTARALAERNIVADLVADEYVAEGLLRVFPDPPSAGGRVLLARAEEAREVLPEGLSHAGWSVDVVPVYKTVAAQLDAEPPLADADVVTFTSSSTVRNFVELVGADSGELIVACIGPVTAATATDLGLRVVVEAANHTIVGLVDALEDWALGSAK